MKKLIIIGYLLVHFSIGYTQEVVTYPVNNTYLKSANAQLRVSSLDTLSLPFVDDFSNSYLFPSTTHWTDRNVYINQDLAIHPVTLGVATFDGLNSQGRAYDNSSSTTYGKADELTSQAINLAGKSVSDSVYLSFWLQPQGSGDAPELRDSFVVQFFDSSAQWQTVYKREGGQLDTFRLVLVPLNQLRWLHSGFQFRMINYASLTGLVDLWHIDYVYLNENRSMFDTILNDVAFKEKPTSILNEYQEMPYKQFLVDTSRFKRLLHGARSVNLNSAKNTSFSFSARDIERQSLIFSSTPFSITFPANSTFIFESPTFGIAYLNTDSFSVQLEYRLNTTPDALSFNDTVRRTTNFWNHYAYDDGSAENGYGLNVLAGQIAYKFILSEPDTLRGIWMYFIESSERVSNELFNLRVWKYIPEGQLGGSEILLVDQPLLSPEYSDSLERFVYYPLETPIPVTDSFYVGWQQGTNKLLNIGLDRSNNANSKMFYNVDGSWNSSSINGAWMIRPVVGKELRWPTFVQDINTLNLKLYPNPATDLLKLDFDEFNVIYTVYSLTGGILMNGLTNEKNVTLNVSGLSNGIYLVKCVDQNGRQTYKKFIIQK
jgi:hypothetical protein